MGLLTVGLAGCRTLPAPAARAAPAATATSPQTVDLGAQAQRAWSARLERSQLERAIALYEQLLRATPEDGAAATSLAQAYWLLATGFMLPTGEVEPVVATLTLGMDAAQRAIWAWASAGERQQLQAPTLQQATLLQLSPAAQPGLYWYALNLAQLALVRDLSFTLRVQERLVQLLTRSLAQDEGYDYAGGHRTLGALYASLPEFMGGGATAALPHLERALALAPQYLANKVLYAERGPPARAPVGRCAQLLQEVRQTPADLLPEADAEQILAQRRAARLLSAAYLF